MKDVMVPIDQAGRVVLPKAVRQELAIKSGDLLKVSILGSSVTLTPGNQASGLVRRGKALVFCGQGDEPLTGETVERILEQQREGRHAHISRGIPGRGSRK